MFKIRVIRWSDRAENCDLLERYFRLRHAIYVETRKWSEIERPIPMEIDAFDDRNAIYLIGVDGQGSIMGERASSRPSGHTCLRTSFQSLPVTSHREVAVFWNGRASSLRPIYAFQTTLPKLPASFFVD